MDKDRDKRKLSVKQKIKQFFKGNKNAKASNNKYLDPLNRQETIDRIDEVEI